MTSYYRKWPWEHLQQKRLFFLGSRVQFLAKYSKKFLHTKTRRYELITPLFHISGVLVIQQLGFGRIKRSTAPKRGNKLIFWAGTRCFVHLFGELRYDDVLRIPKTPQIVSKCSGMLLDKIFWGFEDFVKFRFSPAVFDPDPESA